MKELVVNETAFVGYSPDTGAVYSSQKTAPKKAREAQDVLGRSSEKIAYWGDGNDFPQKIDKALALNADLASGLDWQARALYAGGLGYERIDLETGEGSKQRLPEVESFLFRNSGYLMQACKDFYKYAHVFPEMVVNRAGDKIYWLLARPAGHCRLALQDAQGNISHCYVNANWNDGAGWKDKETIKLPVVDPAFTDPQHFSYPGGSSFVYPLHYPNGKTYYQKADWMGIMDNGWLDLANEIPKFKKHLMQNQMTIKYHVKMPDYYMPWKYPGWENFKPEKKTDLTKKEIKQFDDFLKGAKNSGKSLVTTFKTDQHTGKAFAGWEVSAIDDKLKDGIYLEDSVEATIKIFSALGLDPALFGIIPGKGGSNRSGSDKREALNIYISLIQAHVNVVLRPFDFISWFNGWNTEQHMLRWFFKAPLLQTLDQVAPSKRETLNQEEDAAE